MSLYKCTSCNDLIQHMKVRLSCASCAPRITLCANCYVVQNYPPEHEDDPSHAISLHAHSGFLPVNNLTTKTGKTSRAKNPQYGYDMADRELADHFTAYGVDFALRPRTPPPTPVNSPLDPLSYLPAAQRSAISAFMPAQSTSTPANSLSGGQKPMLSSRGWMDLAICDVLLNPSAVCGQLNRAMQAFQLAVWREWGDIPRDMLPLAPYQPEVERVRVLLEGARLDAEQEVDAVHARLKLEQRGRQHALDLLDDQVWVRW